MPRDFTIRKRVILIVLGVLIAADIGLAAYSWQLARAPRRHADWNALTLKIKQRKGEIERAEQIRKDIPKTKAQLDEFEASLLPVTTGYSSVTAELNSIAKKAGLQIVTLAAHEKDIPNRAMEEVTIDATVNGDYPSVVRFINGMQRSQSLYAIDGLALGSEAQNRSGTGPLRVALHIRTYFRTVA